MLDRYKRDIRYLRISVTDRCNLRCIYCMPEEKTFKKSHKENMSFDYIVKVAEAAVSIGVNKIRLTGGEPLVKHGIVKLVSMLKKVKGIKLIAMTTNAVLLDRLAVPLKKAGLDSINISLDTLDPVRYRELTRIGDISRVLDGLRAAQKLHFKKIKINMVVMEDTGDMEIEAMRRFCIVEGLELQLINHYELSKYKSDAYAFDRPPKCAACNRIRLTADGYLKPCLHSNREVILNPEDLAGSLKEAVLAKPSRGRVCTNRSMIEIGG
ncbi:MAG: radical SAM protein [Spirochaetes bacterium]|nr:radical SAM protein [Spirochaetota bacterium]